MTISPESPHSPLTSTNLADFNGPTSMLPGTSTTICCLSIHSFTITVWITVKSQRIILAHIHDLAHNANRPPLFR